MNEVLIVTHPGDHLENIIELADSIVKLPMCSHVVFEFNGINLYYRKNSNKDSLFEQYHQKLQSI